MARAWRASGAAPPQSWAERSDRSLRLAGATAIGGCGGLAALVVLAWAGVAGFARASALPQALPTPVLATAAMVLAAGSCAVAATTASGVPYLALVRRIGVAATIFAAAGWLVAAYDNGWSATGWSDVAHTMSLVWTLALLPLSHCALTAALVLRGRGRQARRHSRPAQLGATACLALCVGWLAYLTVPYILSWGPVLLVLLVCGVVVVLPRIRPLLG
jgi:hypothetical protein